MHMRITNINSGVSSIGVTSDVQPTKQATQFREVVLHSEFEAECFLQFKGVAIEAREYQGLKCPLVIGIYPG